MEFVDIEDKSKLEEMKAIPSIVFSDVEPGDEQEYIDYFKDYSDVDENQKGYSFTGKILNEVCDMKVKSNMHYLLVPLSVFKKPEKAALERFQIGGRLSEDFFKKEEN